MLHKTEAIILKTFAYGEADKIVTFLTPDHGKLKGIAKGARKSQKRFGAALEMGSVVELGFQNSRSDLVLLQDAVSISPNLSWRKSLETMTVVQAVLEWTDSFLRDGQAEKKKFDLLQNLLASLNVDNPLGILIEFERTFLEYSGFALSWSCCVECLRNQHSGKWQFDPEHGGLLCPACHRGRGIPIDPVRLQKEVPHVIQTLLEYAFKVIVGRPLRSEKSIHEILL